MIDENPPESHLEYMPPPTRPADFDRQLKNIVPRCPTGETYLRFSWGMDVTEILDGKVLRRYPDPDGKYVGLPYWVLEGWQSPDVYDEKQWRENEDLLGPYPISGVWDFIGVVKNAKGEFVNLGGFALQMARTWRFWQSKPRARAIEEVMKERCKLQVLKEQQADEHKQQIMDEFIRDYSRAERGGYDPRNRKLIGTISKGEYQQTPSGLLIPKLA